MDTLLEDARRHANDARYQPGQPAGHYESYFVRANHPARPLAFWIRYTIFSPAGRPDLAKGELWAIVFDGETGRHVAVKREVPIAQCDFARDHFAARVGTAELRVGSLAGEAASGGHTIAWDLTYRGAAEPLFLMPLASYARPGTAARSLVGLPLAVFAGRLVVDGAPLEVADWAGSQNHNWGARHTDHYAWGQVAGFDGRPDTFLEVATARRRLGPLWSPFVTLLVLRHAGEEITLNTLTLPRRAHGAFAPFTWWFRGATSQMRIAGRISAPSEAFVALTYRNPPGGVKICQNSKIATCELTLTRREGGAWGEPERLIARERAAFEILSDQPDARVPVLI
jgi:hypothetical protein